MTIDEFLSRLAATALRLQWRVTLGGYLRASISVPKRTPGAHDGSLPCCPVTAVAWAATGDTWDVYSAPAAAYNIGVSQELAGEIMGAADRNNRSELRTRLLKAVGLATEQQEV